MLLYNSCTTIQLILFVDIISNTLIPRRYDEWNVQLRLVKMQEPFREGRLHDLIHNRLVLCMLRGGFL